MLDTQLAGTIEAILIQRMMMRQSSALREFKEELEKKMKIYYQQNIKDVFIFVPRVLVDFYQTKFDRFSKTKVKAFEELYIAQGKKMVRNLIL
jgi:hypothetical protein